MPNRLFESFNAAIEGFLHVIKTQRNMRIHFLLAMLILLLGVFLNFTPQELAIIVLAGALVFATEMINTAIELVVDIVVKMD